MKVPVVYSPKPKMAISVAGELTTHLNQRITVLPNGTVVVDTENGSDEDELTDEDGQGSVYESVSYKTGKVKEKNGNQTQEQDAKEEERGDVEEQVLEEAEDMYLNLRGRKRKQNIPKSEGDYDDDDRILEEAEAMYLEEHREQNKAAKKGNNKQSTPSGNINSAPKKGKPAVQLQNELDVTAKGTNDITKQTAKKIKSVPKESKLDCTIPVDAGRRGKKPFRYFSKK